MDYKITNLLIKPRSFFEELKKKEGYKGTIIYFFTVSVLIYLLWFIKTILKVHNVPIASDISTFNMLFDSFGYLFIRSFLIFLVAYILVLFVISAVVAILIKIFCVIFKIKLTLNKSWTISVYGLVAFLSLVLFQLISHLLNISFLTHFDYLFYIYYLILLLIGFSVFTKMSETKFVTYLIVMVSILILVSGFIIIKDYGEDKSPFTNLTVKIGNEVIFTQEDIVSVCDNIDCVDIYPDTHCYETENKWVCGYNFGVTLNEESARRFAKVTNGTGSKTISYYLDGKLIDEVTVGEDLKGIPATELAISGTSEGSSEREAISNSFSDMNKLRSFLLK